MWQALGCSGPIQSMRTPGPISPELTAPCGSEVWTVSAQATQGPGDPPLTTERNPGMWGPSPTPERVAVLLVSPFALRNPHTPTPFSSLLGLKQIAMDKCPLLLTAKFPSLTPILEDVAVKAPPLQLGWRLRLGKYAILAPGPRIFVQRREA